jgi:hypothetical protein
LWNGLGGLGIVESLIHVCPFDSHELISHAGENEYLQDPSEVHVDRIT